MKIFAIAAFLWIAGSVNGNPEETVRKDGRMPHLFIFKKLSNGTSTRHKKNANFVLVDTLYRQNGTNDVKYSPLVSENYVSTTPASVPRNHNPTRRSADPTPSPNFRQAILAAGQKRRVAAADNININILLPQSPLVC